MPRHPDVCGLLRGRYSSTFPDLMEERAVSYVQNPTQTHLHQALEFLRTEDIEVGHSFICNQDIIEEAHAKGNTRFWIGDDGEVEALLVFDTSHLLTTISIVAVDFQRRGRGIGRRLFEAFEAEAATEFVAAALWLFCEPADSEKFWRAMGFVDLPTLTRMTDMERHTTLYKMLHEPPRNDPNPNIQIRLWNVDYYRGIPNSTPDFELLLNNTVDHEDDLVFHAYYDQAVRVTVDGVSREAKVKYSPLQDYREGSFVWVGASDIDYMCNTLRGWVTHAPDYDVW